MYLFQGKAAPGQLAIFASEPGERSYSPIWRETIMTWKASGTPILVTSDTQIDRLEKKGVLSERTTSVRLNCPIIEVGKGAQDEPAFRGHTTDPARSIREEEALATGPPL